MMASGSGFKATRINVAVTALAASLLLVGTLAGIASCGGGGAGVTEVARNAAACSDFYEYVNADWMAATPLPKAGEATDNYTGIEARNQQALLAALAAEAASSSPSPAHGALIAAYRSLLDRSAVDALGIVPLAYDFALIDGLHDMSQLASVVGRLTRRGIMLPIRHAVRAFDDQEPDAPSTDTLALSLEIFRPAHLPVKGDNTSEAAFTAHVERTLALLGNTHAAQAGADMTAVVEMELRARALADGAANAGSSASPFDIAAFRAAARVPATLPLTVAPDALAIMSAMQAEFGVEQWRAFLRWRTVVSSDAQLAAAFMAERVRWEGTEGIRSTVDQLTFEPILTFLGKALPQQLDAFYVDKVMPAESVANAIEIAVEIKAAMHRHIDSRAWASAATRANMHRIMDTTGIAFYGMDTVNVKTSPGATLAPVAPTLGAGTLLANSRMAAEYDFDRRMSLAMASRSGRTSNGDAWYHYEPNYNAVNKDVVMHAVVAQILLENSSDAAARYGSLGAITIHELFHAFSAPSDSQFTPADTTWLDAADRDYFNGQVVKLAADYQSDTIAHYGVEPIEPRFMGEDLSDLGAVPVALDAFRHAYPNSPYADVFKAWAFQLRDRSSLADDLEYIKTVPAHAIYRYRANGPLSNLPAFASAYGCTPADPMVRKPAQQVELW